MSTFQVASNRPNVQVKIVSQGDQLTTFDEPSKEALHSPSDDDLVSLASLDTGLARKTDAESGSGFKGSSIFSSLSKESQSTLHKHQNSFNQRVDDGQVQDFTEKQKQMHSICMYGLQQLKSDFRKLNRSNVYSQHFVVNHTLQEFTKSLICVELMLSLMTYLDTWIVAASDLEVLLCDYENRSSQEAYGSDKQCFEEYLLVCRYQHILNQKKKQSNFWETNHPNVIPSTDSPNSTPDDLTLAAEEATKMEDLYSVTVESATENGNTLRGAGTVTRARERVLRRVSAIVHRVNREINRPQESLMSRHRLLRKRLLWLSSSARALPKHIAELGSKYYRAISWCVQYNALRVKNDTQNTHYLQNSITPILKHTTNDTFYDHLILLCEKVVQTLYPALWPRLRGEISRLFRSSKYSQSIGRQRARDTNIYRAQKSEGVSVGGKTGFSGGSNSNVNDNNANTNNGSAESMRNNSNNMRNNGEEAETGKQMANPYSILPSIVSTTDYVSLTRMGVHSALAFLLLGTHHTSVTSTKAIEPPQQKKSQAQVDIIHRLSEIREDKTKSDATESPTQPRLSEDKTKSDVTESPTQPRLSEDKDTTTSTTTGASSSGMVDERHNDSLLPVISVVVPLKMRHIELHHFYEVEYKDMKYEPTSITAPFDSETGRGKVYTFPTTTNNPLSVNDQRSPLLDIVHPAHSSLQKFQKNMIRARAQQLAEDKRSQQEADDDVVVETSSFQLQPVYISQVDFVGMLRPNMRGETHLKNDSKVDSVVKDNDPRPKYMRGMDKQGAYMDDPAAISFSSFASSSTINTVGIKRPTRKMRSEMERVRTLQNPGMKPAPKAQASMLTVDSSKQLKTNFTKQLMHVDTFDRVTDIDYLATIINEDQKVYTKSNVDFDRKERSEHTRYNHIIPVKAQYNPQDSLETLIVQFAEKQNFNK